jgi:hypothetical protein
MKKILLTLILISFVLLNNYQAGAVITLTTGAGSAVTSVDRSANFNSLVDGADLSTYTENLLSITTPGVASLGFDPFKGAGDGTPFHYTSNYASGVNDSWVTIRTIDGALMRGVEFLYGNGWGDDGPVIATIYWQAYLGTTLVSSGSEVQHIGTVLGFSDPAGFDSLLVRATLFADGYSAIALDALRVQIVPEPSTCIAGALLLLLPFGASALRILRKRSTT